MNWPFVWGVVVVGFTLGFVRPGMDPQLHTYVSLAAYLVLWLVVRKKPTGKPSRVPLIFMALAAFVLPGAAAKAFPDAALVFGLGQGLVLLAVLAYIFSLNVRAWVDLRLLKR